MIDTMVIIATFWHLTISDQSYNAATNDLLFLMILTEPPSTERFMFRSRAGRYGQKMFRSVNIDNYDDKFKIFISSFLYGEM